MATRSRRRPAIILSVLLAHLAVLYGVTGVVTPSHTSPSTRLLTITLWETNNPERQARGVDPLVSQIALQLEPDELASLIHAMPAIHLAEVNGDAAFGAPQLLDAEPPDSAPFARQASLLQGETALGVLSLEILPDGSVGDVRIDASGGRQAIDAAAAA